MISGLHPVDASHCIIDGGQRNGVIDTPNMRVLKREFSCITGIFKLPLAEVDPGDSIDQSAPEVGVMNFWVNSQDGNPGFEQVESFVQLPLP